MTGGAVPHCRDGGLGGDMNGGLGGDGHGDDILCGRGCRRAGSSDAATVTLREDLAGAMEKPLTA